MAEKSYQGCIDYEKLTQSSEVVGNISYSASNSTVVSNLNDIVTKLKDSNNLHGNYLGETNFEDKINENIEQWNLINKKIGSLNTALSDTIYNFKDAESFDSEDLSKLAAIYGDSEAATSAFETAMEEDHSGEINIATSSTDFINNIDEEIDDVVITNICTSTMELGDNFPSDYDSEEEWSNDLYQQYLNAEYSEEDAAKKAKFDMAIWRIEESGATVVAQAVSDYIDENIREPGISKEQAQQLIIEQQTKLDNLAKKIDNGSELSDIDMQNLEKQYIKAEQKLDALKDKFDIEIGEDSNNNLGDTNSDTGTADEGGNSSNNNLGDTNSSTTDTTGDSGNGDSSSPNRVSYRKTDTDKETGDTTSSTDSTTETEDVKQKVTSTDKSTDQNTSEDQTNNSTTTDTNPNANQNTNQDTSTPSDTNTSKPTTGTNPDTTTGNTSDPTTGNSQTNTNNNLGNDSSNQNIPNNNTGDSNANNQPSSGDSVQVTPPVNNSNNTITYQPQGTSSNSSSSNVSHSDGASNISSSSEISNPSSSTGTSNESGLTSLPEDSTDISGDDGITSTNGEDIDITSIDKVTPSGSNTVSTASKSSDGGNAIPIILGVAAAGAAAVAGGKYIKNKKEKENNNGEDENYQYEEKDLFKLDTNDTSSNSANENQQSNSYNNEVMKLIMDSDNSKENTPNSQLEEDSKDFNLNSTQKSDKYQAGSINKLNLEDGRDVRISDDVMFGNKKEELE